MQHAWRAVGFMIYVISMNRLQLVFMARKHKSGNARILMLDCMISQVSCGF
jgi:hypothetical protein